MECGISLLNRMKEIQNRTLVLKKISNEIYDETVRKVNELNFLEEQIKLKGTILEEHKKILAELESETNFINKNLVTWENLLNNKKTSLEIEKEQLKELQNKVFSARINHCESVKNFLNEKVNLETNDVPQANIDSELFSYRIDIVNLEQELELLERIIDENKFEKLKSDITQKLKNEESQYQNTLELHKNKLRKLVYEVKIRKLQKSKRMLKEYESYSPRKTEIKVDSMPISSSSVFFPLKNDAEWKTLMNEASKSENYGKTYKWTDNITNFLSEAKIKRKDTIQNVITKMPSTLSNNLRKKISNSEDCFQYSNSNLTRKRHRRYMS